MQNVHVCNAKNTESIQARILRSAPAVADNFLSLARSTRLKRSSNDATVAEEVKHFWARGWTAYDAVINSMEQSAASMGQRSSSDDAHADSREALLLLQSMATLTLREIRELLVAGYLSGAAARWRALHEIAVTALLIAEGGPRIASRYVDHGIATQILRLEEFYKQPHPQAPPIEERADRLAKVDGLIAKHEMLDESIKFPRPYAWAMPLMPISPKTKKRVVPTFERLEEVAGQLDMRLLVAHGANGYVHNDAGAVRTAVLRYGSDLNIGPRSDEIQTVAIPALRTAAILAAATHSGFEPEYNDYGLKISLAGAAIAELAMFGVNEFESFDRTIQLLF